MSRFSFRQVGGSRKYRSWKKFAEGDYFIGKLIKDYEDQFGNVGYEIVQPMRIWTKVLYLELMAVVH